MPSEFPAVPSHLKWDLWLGPAKKRPYSPAYCPYNWRFWWDFGTGESGNWGCHILDIPFWALQLKYPNRVDLTDVHDRRSGGSIRVEVRAGQRKFACNTAEQSGRTVQ